MFIVAYGIDGAILHHAVPPRQTVNAAYYCTFPQHNLRPALRRKRLSVLQNHIILHDNARSHTAAAIMYLLRLLFPLSAYYKALYPSLRFCSV